MKIIHTHCGNIAMIAPEQRSENTKNVSTQVACALAAEVNGRRAQLTSHLPAFSMLDLSVSIVAI